jgi:hypothetical protein
MGQQVGNGLEIRTGCIGFGRRAGARITSSARASTVARKCELLHAFAAKGSRTIID